MISEGLSKDLNFQSLFMAIFLSLHGQSYILKWLFLHEIANPDRQTFLITQNWYKRPLTASQDLLENFSLELLCDVIFFLLPDQSEVPSIRKVNF